MYMIRHNAKLQDANLRMYILNMKDSMDDFFAEICALDEGLRRIVIRNNKRAQQGFPRRDSQCDMVDPNTFPRRFRFLPRPLIVCHIRISNSGTKLV